MELTFRPQLTGDEDAARTLLKSQQSTDRANGANWDDVFGGGRECDAAHPGSGNVSTLAETANIYVGFVGDEMVGAAIITLKDNNNLYINHMAVLPDRRGRGIGRWMLTCLEAVAQNAHCKKMSFSTSATMSDLLHLCGRFGFRETYRVIDQAGGSHHFRVSMEKIL